MSRPARSGRTRLAAALCGAVTLALPGCKSIDGERPSLIPNRALVVSRSLSIPADTMLLAAGAFLLIDPLAPNWHVEALELAPRRYAIALTKKRYATGGDGEAVQMFRRHASELAAGHGYAGYEVVEYSEGIESRMPIAQRVSRGVVVLR